MRSIFTTFFALTLISLSTLNAQSFTVDESINPFDRGNATNSQEDIVKLHDEDLKKMADHYKGGLNGCFQARSVPYATCKLVKDVTVVPGSYPAYTCNDLHKFDSKLEIIGIPEEVPYYEYYVPFQKMEHTENAFATKYLSKDLVKGILSQSANAYYDGRPDAIEDDLTVLTKRMRSLGYDLPENFAEQILTQVPAAIELVKRYDLQKYRMRGVKSASGQNMDSHILPSFFHDTYRGFYKNIWVHHGSKQAWVRKKQDVQSWFSEFPENINITRSATLGRSFKDINELMAPTNQFNRCVKGKAELMGIHNLIPANRMNKSDKHCLPGMYGPKVVLPFNLDSGTYYASQAATTRDYMGLNLANILSKQVGAYLKGAMHEVRLEEEAAQLPVPSWRYKADMLQFIDERRSTAQSGCNVSLLAQFSAYGAPANTKFLPSINWSQQIAANDNTEGEHFSSVHYRYIRGCPLCYAPDYSAPPQILR